MPPRCRHDVTMPSIFFFLTWLLKKANSASHAFKTGMLLMELALQAGHQFLHGSYKLASLLAAGVASTSPVLLFLFSHLLF